MNEIDFILRFGQLKRHVRTGWLSKGVSPAHVESIADHVSRTVLIAMMLAEKLPKTSPLNHEKVLRMALLHDIVEIVLKDIDKEAWSQLSPDQKIKRAVERRIVRGLFACFPPTRKRRYLQEWEDYREKKTLESKIVIAADKLELAVQAYEYTRQGIPKTELVNMIEDCAEEIRRLKLPQATQIFSEICSLFDKKH